MNTIPKEYLDLAQSPQIYESCEKIGEKLGLNLSQVGELDAEIGDIITGQSRSADFSKNITRRLEIDQKLADQVTTEANTQILEAIKKQLQANMASSDSSVSGENLGSTDISAIEKAGGFSVEKDTSTLEDRPDLQPGNQPSNEREKRTIIDSIENPKPSPEQIFKKNIEAEEDSHVDPIADLLLNQPAANPVEHPTEHKTAEPPVGLPVVETGEPAPTAAMPVVLPTPATKPQPVPPTPPAVDAKSTGGDSYREPIN